MDNRYGLYVRMQSLIHYIVIRSCLLFFALLSSDNKYVHNDFNTAHYNSSMPAGRVLL